jgi:hypothetical protein
VVVGLGSRAVQYPIPLTGDGPVTLRFAVSEREAARAAFDRECDDLRGRVAQAAVAFEQLAAGLSTLIGQGKNAEALLRATQGLAAQEAEDAGLSGELARLRADPQAADPRAAATLQSAEQALANLRAARPELKQRADDLQTLAARSQDPAVMEREFREKSLVADIKRLVEAGEVDAALAVYDQLVDMRPADPAIKRQRDKLKADWGPKDRDHAQAREVVSESWRKVGPSADDLRAATDKLSPAITTLTAKEDRLGLRLALAGFEPVYVRLKALGDALDPAGEADKPKRDRLAELAADLAKLKARVQKAIQAIEGK